MSALDGFLNVYKPLGISFRRSGGTREAHTPARHRDRARRHAGSGSGRRFAPVRGQGHRLFDYIVDKQKRYIAEVTLGKVTDTQDAAGTVLEERPVRVGEAEIRAARPS